MMAASVLASISAGRGKPRRLRLAAVFPRRCRFWATSLSCLSMAMSGVTFPLAQLSQTKLPAELDAQLVLVDNPQHHPRGDFSLQENLLSYKEAQRFTFSGISLFRPALFAAYQVGSEQCFPLRDVLRPAILAGRVGGSVYTGSWCDVGTVERYQQLQTFVKTHNN